MYIYKSRGRLTSLCTKHESTFITAKSEGTLTNTEYIDIYSY